MNLVKEKQGELIPMGLKELAISGLENSTRPLIFTSASGCRASEFFYISSENYFFYHICQ